VIELACPGRPTLAVGKIVAVGRNYADHVREMGGAPAAGVEPILFLKPPSALVLGAGSQGRCEVELPSFSAQVHHEVELVVRVGRPLRRADASAALAAIDAIAVGLDLTARDLQSRARERGEPWSVAKGFDGSAPLSPLVALEPKDAKDAAARLAELEVALAVNGASRQRGRVPDMTTPVPQLLAFVSSRFRLEPGDLVFTGTPAGVGPVVAGDVAVAELRAKAAVLARLEVNFSASA